jgi:hypothetical protein
VYQETPHEGAKVASILRVVSEDHHPSLESVWFISALWFLYYCFEVGKLLIEFQSSVI